MVKFSIAALTSLVAVASATKVPTDFYLTTDAQNGPKANDDLFLNVFHTGAGENAVIGLKSFKAAPKLSYNSTTEKLYFYGGSNIIYTLGVTNLTPYNSTAPAGYKLVTLSVDGGSKGFEPVKGGEFTFANKAVPSFDTFAICNVDGISPYKSLGPQRQLLWRGKSTKLARTCSDVKLQVADAEVA